MSLGFWSDGIAKMHTAMMHIRLNAAEPTIVLGPSQHLYQAAAMIVNIFVAVPASLRHHRAKAIRWNVVFRMMPAGIIMITFGVLASDLFAGRQLRLVFSVFLVYVIYINVMKLLGSKAEPTEGEERPTWPRASSVGTITGFMAGLLGIGGGIVTVPLLQRICVLPLRQCIACSSAVMCLTAIVGACIKNATLHQHGHEISSSLQIAACLAPTALVGGLIGASLTHVLPLKVVRVAFILLMSAGALRMIGVI